MQLPPATRQRIMLGAIAAVLVCGLIYAGQPLPTPPETSAQAGAQVQAPPQEPKATAYLELQTARMSQKQVTVAGAATATGSLVAAGSTGQAEVAAAVKAEARPKVQEYTVVSGDTVESIAQRFGIKSETVLWANDLNADDLLQVGEALQIPGVDGIIQKVHAGDTLWDLALEHDADMDAIVQANPDIDPGVLQPGQVVLIPGGKPAARLQVVSRSGVRANVRTFDNWPARGSISDPFGWRIHPVYGTRSFHDGMDIDVRSGTPLHAVSGGTVVMAARYGGYGLAVRIDHGRGIVTQYSHMSQINVAVGQKVESGEAIGYSGNTGVTTGPHLHFSVIVNGTPVDPAPWLP